jgi:hypothetical protein
MAQVTEGVGLKAHDVATVSMLVGVSVACQSIRAQTKAPVYLLGIGRA